MAASPPALRRAMAAVPPPPVASATVPILLQSRPAPRLCPLLKFLLEDVSVTPALVRWRHAEHRWGR
eukprot:7342134-Alexandrium_andersonii.AAC.1